MTHSHNRSDLIEEPWEVAFQSRARKYRWYEKGRRDNRTWRAGRGWEAKIEEGIDGGINDNKDL